MLMHQPELAGCISSLRATRIMVCAVPYACRINLLVRYVDAVKLGELTFLSECNYVFKRRYTQNVNLIIVGIFPYSGISKGLLMLNLKRI